MRKRTKMKTREFEGDPRYGNLMLEKFINHLMRAGKKDLARSIVYGAFDLIKEKTEKEPLEIFDLAMKNASPLLEVRSRRVGGANYQVPREARGNRRTYLAIHWMLQTARAKKGKPMPVKLAEEIMAAANNEGEAVRRKENMHKMAEANRAFAHFAW